MDAMTGALRAWLGQRLSDVTIELPTPTRPAAGASSETYFLAPRVVDDNGARTVPMVLRVEPAGDRIYQNPSIAREFGVLDMLGRQGEVPVPSTLWLEADATIIGAPFMVMAHVGGQVPDAMHHSTGLLAEASLMERREIWQSAIGAMALIHNTDPAPFSFLGSSRRGLDAEFTRWQAYMRWSGVSLYPIQEKALRWLMDNQPTEDCGGLAWGDARPENMIFRDRRCVAVIDWETVSLGGAESDLTWWLFFDWLITDGFGIPRLEGFPGRDETLSYWESCAQRSLRHIEWHEVFAAWRFGLISARSQMLAGQADEAGPGAPWLSRLAQLLG